MPKWEAVREIIAKLKEECAVFHDFDGEAVDDFFDEYEDEIRDEIYSRNDSDVVKELVRHTDDIPTLLAGKRRKRKFTVRSR